MNHSSKIFLYLPFNLLLMGILAFVATPAFGQTGATGARGIVVDALTNEPMTLATVQFDGKSKGAITDMDGKFDVEINEPVSRLKVTYMGYQTVFVDLKPGQPNDLNVRMEEANNTLQEVVVRKEKYRNKGNPAVELIEKVIENKDRNRREGLDFFNFDFSLQISLHPFKIISRS